jgi:hypothetical protein
VDDGLICGNRLEALPPGMVVDTPATAGSGPTGMLDPSPSEPSRPEIVAVEPPGVDELVPPAPAEADDEADGLGLAGLAGALATVTVAALADLLTFLPVLASATETVAV